MNDDDDHERAGTDPADLAELEKSWNRDPSDVAAFVRIGRSSDAEVMFDQLRFDLDASVESKI
ncbi:MAG: hypothetical protein QOK24_1364 [Verrucomicrobiota bacterium]|jgi:hypothetical protein